MPAAVAQKPFTGVKKGSAMRRGQSNLGFRLMALAYRLRDFRLSRKIILEEVGIRPGFRVLDYGCGPGGYVFPTARLVGEAGKVYALDRHPLAIESVKKIVSGRQMSNVETILSDCQTGLPDNSLDAVLLYDVFHHLRDKKRVLKELHRVLKQDGILSFSDHHMKESQIVSQVTSGGLFKLSKKGRRTYTFSKN